MTRRKGERVNWDALRQAFEVDGKSFRQLAAMEEAGGVSFQAISQHAKRNNWVKAEQEEPGRSVSLEEIDDMLDDAERARQSALNDDVNIRAEGRARLDARRESLDRFKALCERILTKLELVQSGQLSIEDIPEIAGKSNKSLPELVNAFANIFDKIGQEEERLYRLSAHVSVIKPFMIAAPSRGVPGGKG